MKTKLVLISMLCLLAFSAFAVSPSLAAVSGSLSSDEVVVGGRVTATWTGLTDGSVYSVEIDGVTEANFTASGTRHEHSILISTEGVNTITLYLAQVSQKVLYCTGVSMEGYFPKDLIMGVFGVIVVALIIVAIVVGLLKWLKGGIKF